MLLRVAKAESPLEMILIGANRLRWQDLVQPLPKDATISFDELGVEGNGKLPREYSWSRVRAKMVDNS